MKRKVANREGLGRQTERWSAWRQVLRPLVCAGVFLALLLGGCAPMVDVIRVDVRKDPPVRLPAEWFLGDTAQLRSHLDSLLAIYMKPGDTRAIIETYGPTDSLARADQQNIRRYLSTWETQDRVLFVFPKQKWNKAFTYAKAFQWDAARDIWSKCLESRDLAQQAAAAFNLAVYCEMMGELDLALKWLDEVDTMYLYPETDYYRTILQDLQSNYVEY